MAANVRPHEGDIEVPLISDLLTARVTDLFNVSYEILLQILERFFAHTQETDAQLKTLADATTGLMTRVLKPLGDLITTLPVGEGHAGMTAGPSFELFYENDYLMPHREAAWALLAERLDEAGWLCSELRPARDSASRAGSIRSWRPCGRCPGPWLSSCPREARTPSSRRTGRAGLRTA